MKNENLDSAIVIEITISDETNPRTQKKHS